MNSELLTALLALFGTALGSVSGVLAAARLTNFRLSQLEEKVKLHNNMIERLTTVEMRAKSNSHRIDDLERAEEDV